jgi:hypothetical protein
MLAFRHDPHLPCLLWRGSALMEEQKRYQQHIRIGSCDVTL